MLSAQSSQVSDDKLYVDDVFSAYTYTGNGSTQTINNGIDLAGKGGMVWIKGRSSAYSHTLTDTSRGVRAEIYSNDTSGQVIASPGGVSAFNSNGFSIESRSIQNLNAATYVSWTFRKAPKFFDVVTWTGDDNPGRVISHSLGIRPGMIIAKTSSNAENWIVKHASMLDTNFMKLNLTDVMSSTTIMQWGYTSTGFDVTGMNVYGRTYVAYLFAHDTSTDGLIQCGSASTNASGISTVNLGWEPQFLLVKNTDFVNDWIIVDTTRGFSLATTDQYLRPNLSNAELASAFGNPTATGFYIEGGLGNSKPYIYMAIRRPNKPPTTGTQVYNAIARTGTGATATVTGVGFVPDLVWSKRPAAGGNSNFFDRLRGATLALFGNDFSGDYVASTSLIGFDTMAGVRVGTDSIGMINYSGQGYINHFFKRAPGVFDIVCYTGTGVAKTEAHSLGVVPELMIIKCRSTAMLWGVYSAPTGNTQYMVLNGVNTPSSANNLWNNTSPSAATFNVGTSIFTNTVAEQYVTYLFATEAGVSKVGSYTGNGSTQTINCGFTTGARFALIKRTDNTGDWFVWDTARGIVAGTEPHLSLNTTAAEVTSDDSIDPDTSGFIVNQVAATDINVTGASYIFLSFA